MGTDVTISCDVPDTVHEEICHKFANKRDCQFSGCAWDPSSGACGPPTPNDLLCTEEIYKGPCQANRHCEWDNVARICRDHTEAAPEADCAMVNRLYRVDMQAREAACHLQ